MGMKSSERISYSVEYLSYGIFLGAAFGIILGLMPGRGLEVSMLAGTVSGIMLGFMLGSVKDETRKKQRR